MTRHGLTLIELVVVLALMGVLAAVSAFGLGTLRPPSDAVMAELQRARSEALRRGMPVTIEVMWDSTSSAPAMLRFLPDGRALGDGVDPLTGEPNARP